MKKGKPKTTETKQTPGAMDAKEKSVYLSQIQDLSARLESLQRSCDKLKQQNHNEVKQKEHLSSTPEILQHSSAELDKEEEEVMEGLKKVRKLRPEDPELQKKAEELRSEVSEKATKLVDLQKIAEALRLLQVTSSSEAAAKPRVDSELLEQCWMSQMEEDMQDRKQEMEIKQNVFGYKYKLQRCLQELELAKSSRTSAEKQRDQALDTIKEMKLKSDSVLRNISSKQQKRTRCELWSNEVKRLESSHQNQLDQNQADRQRLAALRDECLQEPSLIAQLKVQLQGEREKKMKAEREIQFSVSVLTPVMDSETMPGAQLMIQKVLSVLEKSKSRQTGIAHRETPELRRGGPKPQTSRAAALDRTSEPLPRQNVRPPPPPTPTCSQPSPGRAHLRLKKLDFWNTALNDLMNKLDETPSG
ncbi:myosin heavy chain, clone 203 isoform X2 [Nothobranchius furzeri]|uniref:Transcript variant X2 n=1 Tax=Nothobranchius furzeri TaxID=105023 RepID=A0A9D3BD12_NOTFU|nr:transcript variant X2 [Nothobranchius furzeri]